MEKGNGSNLYLILLVLIIIGAMIAALIGQNQALEQEKQVAQEGLKQAAEKWSTLSGQVASIEKEREMARGQLAKVEVERVNLSNQVNQLQHDNQLKEDQLQEKNRALELANAQINDLTVKVNTLTDQLAKKQAELDQARKDLEAAMAEIDTVKNENKALADRVAAIESTITSGQVAANQQPTGTAVAGFGPITPATATAAAAAPVPQVPLNPLPFDPMLIMAAAFIVLMLLAVVFFMYRVIRMDDKPQPARPLAVGPGEVYVKMTREAAVQYGRDLRKYYSPQQREMAEKRQADTQRKQT